MSSSSVGPTIRPADAADDRALAEVDLATWSPIVTPADRWPVDHTVFPEGFEPRDVLVAELDGSIAGYLKLGAPTPLGANRHVLEVQGLAVSPAHQRRGVARGLLAAAVKEARSRGARRLTLRVLATNERARRLYASSGFETEGMLRREFLIKGDYVDDVLMAMRLD